MSPGSGIGGLGVLSARSKVRESIISNILPIVIGVRRHTHNWLYHGALFTFGCYAASVDDVWSLFSDRWPNILLLIIWLWIQQFQLQRFVHEEGRPRLLQCEADAFAHSESRGGFVSELPHRSKVRRVKSSKTPTMRTKTSMAVTMVDNETSLLTLIIVPNWRRLDGLCSPQTFSARPMRKVCCYRYGYVCDLVAFK